MVITSKRIEWSEHIAHMREKRIVYRILFGRSEEKRLSERPRHRRKDNIKIRIKISESVD
jgi:IS5 family transposase